MLNRIIHSNEGKLKTSVEQTAVKVLESYGYNEILIPETDNKNKEIINAVNKELKHCAFPIRLYNLNNYGINYSITGETGTKAKAEAVLLAVNILLALNINDFFITVNTNDSLLKAAVKDYKIEKYILFKENKEFEVLGEFNKATLLKGEIAESSLFIDIDMDAILKILYTPKLKDARNVPVVLVGSQEFENLHKVAFGLRSQGLTCETYISKGTMLDAIEYAEVKNITILIWITEDEKVVMKNVKNGEMSETTLDKILKSPEIKE